jgi:hypothetical protein
VPIINCKREEICRKIRIKQKSFQREENELQKGKNSLRRNEIKIYVFQVSFTLKA